MAGNANYDDILATTLANHRSTLIDNIFTARPLFYFLNKAGNIVQVGGGHKIVQPLIYATNTTAGSYSDNDALTTTHQSGISAAEFNWKQYAVSINIYGIEEAKNNSEEEVIDLLSAKVQQAEETVKENMDSMFLSDETGNSGKDWGGLKNYVAQNASSVGGIDPSTETWWQSYVDATSEVLTVATMAEAYNSVSEGNDQPQLVLTTQALYQKYEALLQQNIRYTNTDVADAGFQNLVFKGASVMYDTYVTANYMYFLNMKYLRLVGHRDVWFTATPFVRPTNQDLRIAQILCYGNLVVSNRSRQGVLTGQTVS